METILVLVFMLCACVGLNSACSCFPDSGPDRFCRYDLIFRGTALAEYKEREEPIDHNDPFSEYDPFSDWVYTVRVDQVVKMPEQLKDAQNITMRTPTQDNLCGTRFPLDVNAIFFAYFNDKEEIETGLCDPNAPWEALSEWDKELITDHIMDYCASKEAAELTSPGTTTDAAEMTPPEP